MNGEKTGSARKHEGMKTLRDFFCTLLCGFKRFKRAAKRPWMLGREGGASSKRGTGEKDNKRILEDSEVVAPWRGCGPGWCLWPGRWSVLVLMKPPSPPQPPLSSNPLIPERKGHLGPVRDILPPLRERDEESPTVCFNFEYKCFDNDHTMLDIMFITSTIDQIINVNSRYMSILCLELI